MVAYELSLLMKAMSKKHLITAVKRTAEMIMSHNGFIEKIEFLGTRELPYKIKAHSQTQRKGSYFLIQYHAPYKADADIKENCKRDLDILRPVIFEKQMNPEFVCTLHEEVQPPSSRAEVQKMMREAEQRLPKNIKYRKKKEELLKDYIF